VSALISNYREEHIFALTQALELCDVYQTKMLICDTQIEAKSKLPSCPAKGTPVQ
jgi:transposase